MSTNLDTVRGDSLDELTQHVLDAHREGRDVHMLVVRSLGTLVRNVTPRPRSIFLNLPPGLLDVEVIESASLGAGDVVRVYSQALANLFRADARSNESPGVVTTTMVRRHGGRR